MQKNPEENIFLQFLVEEKIRSDNESVQEVVHNKTNVMVMEMFIAKCLDGDLATDYIWPEAFKINSSSTDFILVNEGFSQCIYLCSVHIKKKIKIKIAFEELDWLNLNNQIEHFH